MDISSGFGRCDCNGWSCLNGTWNIFLYLTLFLLLTLGGDLLMSCSRAVPQRGFLSPLQSCFELKQPPSFSSAFCPSCSLPAAVLGVSVTALEGLCMFGRELLGLNFADPLRCATAIRSTISFWAALVHCHVGTFSSRYCSFPRV